MKPPQLEAEAAIPSEILIVDDSAENLSFLATMLTRWGYQIREAFNGKMALLSAKANPPDLILLDIYMPDMDGFEVCAQLKHDPGTRDVPIIFISAIDQTEEKVRAFRLGGVDFITKPFNIEEVRARVATHLSVHALKRKLEKANIDLQNTNEHLTREIAVRTQVEMRLQILSRAVQQTASSVIITDTDGWIEYVNPSFLELTGYELEEILGQQPSILKSGQTPVETYDNLWAALKAGSEWRGEFINRKKNGDIFWELAIISPIRNLDGEVTHYVAVKEDITARKQIEAELKRLTITDPLTETLNRRQLMRVGEKELARMRRYQHPISVLMLDIDYFKQINDCYGHRTGDQVLQRTAHTLRGNLRGVDHLGRYGGDEFVIILPETDLSQAQQAAERLRLAIADQCVKTGEEGIRLSISVGAASILDDGTDGALKFESVISCADNALYAAKEAGRNCVRVWQNVVT